MYFFLISQFERISPTIKEVELEDEKRLLYEIDLLNKNYKNRKVFEDENSKQIIDSINKVDLSNMSTFTSLDIKKEDFDYLLTQNLREKVLIKLILIGDKGVGKTFVRDKLLGIESPECVPTKS